MNPQAPKAAIVTGSRPDVYSLLDPAIEFYRRLASLEVVEALYAERHPDGLEIWLILNGASETDRKRIYAEEWALMQAFPDLGLDVHLLDRQEVELETAIDLSRVDIFIRFPEPAHA